MISTTNGMALYVLARNHGHEWTNWTSLQQLQDVGWAMASMAANDGVERMMEERRRENISLPGGIGADICHTTGSGRLTWFCYQGESGHISMSVSRPGVGLYGSKSVVIRLNAKAFNHPADLEIVWELDDIELVEDLVHLRHLRAITIALFNKADEAEINWFLKFIKNPEFATKIRKELAEEMAAAELAAGVPAQRPTSGTVRAPAIVD
jgi:hypothetical protein